MEHRLFYQFAGRSIATSVPEIAARIGFCGEPTPTLPAVAILGDGEAVAGLPPGTQVFFLPSQQDAVESLLAGEPPNAPQNTVPESVTATQIRLWLFRRGISLEHVAAAIAQISDEQARGEAAIQWEYAPYIERSHPLVEAIAASLGLSPPEVDAAFIEASGL